MDFKKLIESKEYNFLRTNEHLGDRIMFLTLGGSHAYGTNIEGSDVDLRGCTMETAKTLIGLSKFEQFEDKKTDTTIYGFNKLINLLMNCNPNIIELLGCKEEHYLTMSKEGKLLKDNTHLFLSQKASRSFGGFAQSQLRRLENNLARYTYDDMQKEKHILNSIKSASNTFNDRYKEFDSGSLQVLIDKIEASDLDEELVINVNLQGYPLRDYKNIWSEINEIIKTYGKLAHLNRKKNDLNLNKDAMRLIRLHLVWIDILEQEQIITYRDKDRALLLEIRNGKFQKEDGTFDSGFFDMLRENEKRLEYAKSNTNLPVNPDYKRIEELVMDVNRRAIINGN